MIKYLLSPGLILAGEPGEICMEKLNPPFNMMTEVRKIWADKAILHFYWCARLYLANDRMFDVWIRRTLAFYGKQMFPNEQSARQVLKNCEDYLALQGYDILPSYESQRGNIAPDQSSTRSS